MQQSQAIRQGRIRRIVPAEGGQTFHRRAAGFRRIRLAGGGLLQQLFQQFVGTGAARCQFGGEILIELLEGFCRLAASRVDTGQLVREHRFVRLGLVHFAEHGFGVVVTPDFQKGFGEEQVRQFRFAQQAFLLRFVQTVPLGVLQGVFGQEERFGRLIVLFQHEVQPADFTLEENRLPLGLLVFRVLAVQADGLPVKADGPLQLHLFRQVPSQLGGQFGVCRFQFGRQDGIAGRRFVATEPERKGHDVVENRRQPGRIAVGSLKLGQGLIELVLPLQHAAVGDQGRRLDPIGVRFRPGLFGIERSRSGRRARSDWGGLRRSSRPSVLARPGGRPAGTPRRQTRASIAGEGVFSSRCFGRGSERRDEKPGS